MTLFIFQYFYSRKFCDSWYMHLYEYCCSINSLKSLRHPLHTKIYIGPDKRVLILRKDWKTAEQDSIIFDQNGSYMYSWGSYFSFTNEFLRMDSRIVQHARRILERKDKERQDDNATKHMKDKFVELQSNSEFMMHMLQIMSQREEITLSQLNMIINRLDKMDADGIEHI